EERVSRHISLESFKNLVRQQNQLLQLDQAKAIASMSSLVSRASAQDRSSAIPLIRRIAAAGGPISPEMERRFAQLQSIFDGSKGDVKGKPSPVVAGPVPQAASIAPHEIEASRHRKVKPDASRKT